MTPPNALCLSAIKDARAAVDFELGARLPRLPQLQCFWRDSGKNALGTVDIVEASHLLLPGLVILEANAFFKLTIWFESRSMPSCEELYEVVGHSPSDLITAGMFILSFIYGIHPFILDSYS